MVNEFIIKRAKNGDEDSFIFILEDFTPLIKAVCKKYFIKNGDFDDLYQEGVIGLLKAVKAFDFMRNCSFYTFANLCIKRQIFTLIHSSNAYKNQLLNQAVTDIYITEEEDIEYAHDNNKSLDYNNPEEIYISKEKLELLETYLKKVLSPLEMDVFYKMKNGYSYTEIATLLSISTKSSDNTIQRIKKKIRKYLKIYNNF